MVVPVFVLFNSIVLEPKSNTGAVVGGVVGGILFLILVGVAIFFILRLKSKHTSNHFT